MLNAYLRERFPARTMAPLVLLIAGGAAATAPGSAGAVTVLLSGGLVLQFRAWDDLEDVERDRLTHPERTLCRAALLWPVRLLAGAAFALNLTLVAASRASIVSVIVLLALNGFFFVWYRWVRLRLTDPIAGVLVVLAKYPVFVCLAAAAPAAPARLALAMVLVYLLLCVYEVAHDARLRARRQALRSHP